MSPRISKRKIILASIISSIAILGCLLILFARGSGFHFSERIVFSNDKQEKKRKFLLAHYKDMSGVEVSIVDLGTFTANLIGDSGRRQLRIGLKLELQGKCKNNQIYEKIMKIQDRILVLLSSKTFEDVNGIHGKAKLRSEIKDLLSDIFSSHIIRNVYFTEITNQHF